MKRNYFKSLLIITLIFFTSLSFAQRAQLASPDKFEVDWNVCEYTPAKELSLLTVARSQFVKDRMENKLVPCSNFVVTYNGFVNFPEAQAAFQFAVDIWSNLLDSDVDIRVTANFTQLGPNVLGSAGPDGFFLLTGPGIPDNTLFPAPLAEQLLGEDADGPTGTSNDINSNFSNSFPFYFGTDATPPGGQIDFVTVVLHELGHGLGVIGLGGLDPSDNSLGRIRRVANGETVPRLVSIWDNFIDGTDILNRTVPILDTDPTFGFPDPSAIMLREFESGDLTSNSPIAVAQNGGVPPPTFAPSPFNSGSSYSHWDSNTFNGTINALMTPSVGAPIHDPGPVMLGFFEDMGWTLCQGTLSTSDLALEDLSISPNPFTETLTINLPSSLRNDSFNVSIIDLNGRVIINQDLNTINGEIIVRNLSSLKSSLYFITVESLDSGVSFTNKIIKR
jgi:hypothetical protein